MGEALDDDAPMTLETACKEFFGGAIRPYTLRQQVAAGRLKIMRIGRTDFTTRAALRAMLDAAGKAEAAE